MKSSRDFKAGLASEPPRLLDVYLSFWPVLSFFFSSCVTHPRLVFFNDSPYSHQILGSEGFPASHQPLVHLWILNGTKGEGGWVRRRPVPKPVFWALSVQLLPVLTASSSVLSGFSRLLVCSKDNSGITWTMPSTSKKPRRLDSLNNLTKYMESFSPFLEECGAGIRGRWATLTYCEGCIFILRRSSGWLCEFSIW